MCCLKEILNMSKVNQTFREVIKIIQTTGLLLNIHPSNASAGTGVKIIC